MDKREQVNWMNEARSRHARERMDDFLFVYRTRLNDWGRPISIADAAKAIGVTERTGNRYVTRLKAENRWPARRG